MKNSEKLAHVYTAGVCFLMRRTHADICEPCHEPRNVFTAPLRPLPETMDE